MSTLLVSTIAAPFRRAGRAFSSHVVRIDLRTLSYDELRALVFEPQLRVSAEFQRDGAEPQVLTAADLREGFLAAETSLGIEQSREQFAQSLHLVDATAAAATVAALRAESSPSAPVPVAEPEPIAEPAPAPAPQPAPAKGAKAKR